MSERERERGKNQTQMHLRSETLVCPSPLLGYWKAASAPGMAQESGEGGGSGSLSMEYLVQDGMWLTVQGTWH